MKDYIIHFRLPSGLVIQAVIEAKSPDQARDLFMESFDNFNDIEYAAKNILKIEEVQ